MVPYTWPLKYRAPPGTRGQTGGYRKHFLAVFYLCVGRLSETLFGCFLPVRRAVIGNTFWPFFTVRRAVIGNTFWPFFTCASGGYREHFLAVFYLCVGRLSETLFGRFVPVRRAVIGNTFWPFFTSYKRISVQAYRRIRVHTYVRKCT